MKYQEIKFLVGVTGILLILIFVTEAIYRLFKPEAEYTRKFLHISSGIVSLSFPIIFHSMLPVIIIVGLFAGLLTFCKRFGFLPSINNINRQSVGSIVFPLAVLLCFSLQLVVEERLFYYIPLLIMFLSDPLAALIGRIYPIRNYYFHGEQKSLGGSLVFFISSLTICLILLINSRTTEIPMPIAYSFLISISATITEGLSRKGTDNFLVPLAIVVLLYLLF